MTTVCLVANTLYYPMGGGHRWAYLNWALGLKSLGCRVVWMEGVERGTTARELKEYIAALEDDLRPYGLSEYVALCFWEGDPLPPGYQNGRLSLEDAAGADLLLNLRYDLEPSILRRFRRTALLDIDPGLLQIWMAAGQIRVSEHDVFFTTSEALTRGDARFPDGGLQWQHAPPCVALNWWPPVEAAEGAPWTTVSHWGSYDDWAMDGDAVYLNDKKVGFEPFLDLPRRTEQPLELALRLGEDQDEERLDLERRGWRVRSSLEAASSPEDYRRYIQGSLGEFSCAKPSCVRLRNAWVSDRTLCYLASGKPAVVQHTGPSELLPDNAGLFRFENVDEAAAALEEAAADYEHHCRLARELAEEHFDAKKVAGKVLERALP